MSHLASPQFKAGADIAPSVFVAISGDDEVQTAGAAAGTIGIMHESIWATPIPGADPNVAVPAGQSKRVYGEDEVCEVALGAGAVAAGDLLTPDANGKAVVATTGQRYGAICLQGNLANTKAKVVVSRGTAP